MRILLIGLPFAIAVFAFTVLARGQWLGTTPIVYGIVMVGLMLIAGRVSRLLLSRFYPDVVSCACDVEATQPMDPSSFAAGARQ